VTFGTPKLPSNNPFRLQPPTPPTPPLPAISSSSEHLLDLTRSQLSAFNRVMAWVGDPNGKQVFRLYGAAGTGKTHLLGVILKHLSQARIALGTLSGKASVVLTRVTGFPARTLHSMLYTLEGEDGAGQLLFRENPDFEINHAELIAVDEVSMVHADMARSLLKLGKRIFVVGDPYQLAPVGGDPGFTNAAPDAELTEIVRQAEGSPILTLAGRARAGKQIAVGKYGDSEVVGELSLSVDHVLGAEQILVGTRARMHYLNARIRELQGARSFLPRAGDKLICLRNAPHKGLLNGGMWRVVEVGDVRHRSGAEKLVLSVESLDFLGTAPRTLEVDSRFFLPRDADQQALARSEVALGYGYAITVHKAQGSQWDSVLLFDEPFDDHAKWRYTAITRAAKTIRIVLP
jgi:ATP-dependent exoDNAse (exonuclease V) alpha subunit